MIKLSNQLFVLALASFGLAILSAVTVPVIKFSTEVLVKCLSEFIDRSDLSGEQIQTLDRTLNQIISNDRQWQSADIRLHVISVAGFIALATAIGYYGWAVRRLENRLMSFNGLDAR